MTIIETPGRVSMRWTAIALAALLAGCGVNQGPFVSAPAASMPAVTTFSWAAQPDDEPGDASSRTAFAAKLEAALRNSGASVSPDAPIQLTLALTRHTAALGSTHANAASAGAIEWLSQPRKRRLLDGCDAQRTDVIVSVSDRRTGAIIDRVRGAYASCGDSTRDAALADRMAAMVAGRLVGRSAAAN